MCLVELCMILVFKEENGVVQDFDLMIIFCLSDLKLS